MEGEMMPIKVNFTATSKPSTFLFSLLVKVLGTEPGLLQAKHSFFGGNQVSSCSTLGLSITQVQVSPHLYSISWEPLCFCRHWKTIKLDFTAFTVNESYLGKKENANINTHYKCGCLQGQSEGCCSVLHWKPNNAMWIT